jgi:hypothetical protein
MDDQGRNTYPGFSERLFALDSSFKLQAAEARFKVPS